MALDALWALLSFEVSGVSEVRDTVYKGFTDTSAVLSEVPKVSNINPECLGSNCRVFIDTSVTSAENVRDAAQLSWPLSCTLDTFDTSEKIYSDIECTKALAIQTKRDPRQVFKKYGPYLSEIQQLASRAYLAHHFNCDPCIAKGRGAKYGKRCDIGQVLWKAYNDAEAL